MTMNSGREEVKYGVYFVDRKTILPYRYNLLCGGLALN